MAYLLKHGMLAGKRDKDILTMLSSLNRTHLPLIPETAFETSYFRITIMIDESFLNIEETQQCL